jgi:hypothetical protein
MQALLLVEQEMPDIRYTCGVLKPRTGKNGQLMLQILAQKLIKAYNKIGYATLLNLFLVALLYYGWLIP